MKNISRLELENIYGKISPFEFKNKLIELELYQIERVHVLYLMQVVGIQTG